MTVVEICCFSKDFVLIYSSYMYDRSFIIPLFDKDYIMERQVTSRKKEEEESSKWELKSKKNTSHITPFFTISSSPFSGSKPATRIPS